MSRIVFVVDDEKVISDTLAAILTIHGFEAIPFTDPLEALKNAQAKRPDILITDVVMPGLNGIELAIRVKLITALCKVVLFSGQSSTFELLERASREGHEFTILGKPVHPKDLLAAIG